MEQPAAGDVGHEPRRCGGEARPVDAGSDIIEHGGRVAAGFREFRFQLLAEHFGPRPIARRFLDLFEIGERVVERPAAQRAPLVGGRFERCRCLAQPFDFGAQRGQHQPPISRAASSAW